MSSRIPAMTGQFAPPSRSTSRRPNLPRKYKCALLSSSQIASSEPPNRYFTSRSAEKRSITFCETRLELCRRISERDKRRSLLMPKDEKIVAIVLFASIFRIVLR